MKRYISLRMLAAVTAGVTRESLLADPFGLGISSQMRAEADSRPNVTESQDDARASRGSSPDGS